ncbi:hypothetical protein K439DRAFT_1531800 [Ramaria rubella]|nr:hypothetical protein K439DRAFT_1531800 [Ramaria rubella]
MHGYLLTAFKDLPAISKLLCLKGNNGYSPCHFCLIRGERMHSSSNKCYYLPLRAPKCAGLEDDDGWNPCALPQHTYESLQAHLQAIQNTLTLGVGDKLSTYYGINGLSLLLEIPSLSFAKPFPHEIMHLFFENFCPMLHDHWMESGCYKDYYDGYCLAPHIWEEIGCEMAAAYKSIPLDFVSAMPDIAHSSYKAEYCLIWMIHLAPILLRG